MIRLILMRHGNTFEEDQIPVQVGSQSDLPLTSFGKEQAKRVGQYFYDERICPSAIFAGELKRQTEFAEIVSDYFDLPIFETPALTEIDYGAWEGLPAEKIQKLWPQEYRSWTENRIWPGSIFGKSEAFHHQLLKNFLDHVKKECKKTVFAVTSQGVLRFFKNEKVKTGNFCEILLFKDRFEIQSWNRG